MSPMSPDRQSGFSVVAAIFLLVVLATLAVIIASVTGIQQASSQLDILGARAYQAARTGIEWGAYQVLDPNNNLNAANCTSGVAGAPVLSNCPASPTNLGGLQGSLAPFTVTVTCALAADTTEGNRNVRVEPPPGLGRDIKRFAALSAESGKQLFAPPIAVHICRVEEIDAQVQRAMQAAHGLGIVELSPGAADGPRAEADGGNVVAGGA